MDEIPMQECNNLKLQFQQGEISCQFVPPGGSMVPGYVLQLLFCEKSQNSKSSTATKAREKNKHRFRILGILEIF
jgi:hypothetical protein